MRVISINTYMGGRTRHDALNAWVRRVKLERLLRESSYASFSVNRDPMLRLLACRSSVNLEELHADLAQSALARIQRLHRNVAIFHRDTVPESLAQAHIHLDDAKQFFHTLYGHLLFVAAYHAVVEALRYVIVVPICGVAGLRDKIKSLNLPKNLFPQSLRPVRGAAL